MEEPMTSAERKEGRYQRRKARREATRAAKVARFDNFEKVFTIEHLYHGYRMSRLGVRWKASTQRYIANALLNIAETHAQLMAGTFRSHGFYEFDLFERGKPRHIRSVDMHERVVQRCLCDYSLIPLLCRSFIHDNGASMKHKGYSFAVNRMRRHLRRHIRQHGPDGYALLFDFKSYFDSIPHELLASILRKKYTDERLLKLIMHFIECFGEKGLGLGSQISQVLALAAADRIDHHIKDVLRFKNYGRYMDDGYVISDSKERLQHCRREILRLCKEMGLQLSEKKTRIVPLRRGFTWLKIKVNVLPSGRLLQRAWRKSVIRERRKLKKLKNIVDSGKLTVKDAWQSLQSWDSHLIGLNAYRTRKTMRILFDRLYLQGGQSPTNAAHCAQWASVASAVASPR